MRMTGRVMAAGELRSLSGEARFAGRVVRLVLADHKLSLLRRWWREVVCKSAAR